VAFFLLLPYINRDKMYDIAQSLSECATRLSNSVSGLDSFKGKGLPKDMASYPRRVQSLATLL